MGGMDGLEKQVESLISLSEGEGTLRRTFQFLAQAVGHVEWNAVHWGNHRGWRGGAGLGWRCF